MPRPILPKPLSEHVATVSRIQRQLELDESIAPKARRALVAKAGELIVELQKAMGK